MNNPYTLVIDHNEMTTGKLFLRRIEKVYQEYINNNIKDYINNANDFIKIQEITKPNIIIYKDFESNENNAMALENEETIKYLDNEYNYILEKAINILDLQDFHKIEKHYLELKKQRILLNIEEPKPIEKIYQEICINYKKIFGIPKINTSLIEMLNKNHLNWVVEISDIKSRYGVEGDFLLLYKNQPIFLIELKRTMMDLQKTIKMEFANIFQQKLLAYENNIPFHFMVCRCDSGMGGVDNYDLNWLENGFRNELGMYYLYKSGMRKLKGRGNRGRITSQILRNVHCSEVEMPWAVYQQPNIRNYKPYDLIEQHRIISRAIINRCNEGLQNFIKKRSFSGLTF